MSISRYKHPFGELLAQHRARKPGLTQTHLAELAGYNQAILVRMSQGKKDLTGPSGRERVVRLIDTLADQGALTLLEEANALLLSADMPPLFERQPNEARLITRLSQLPTGQRTRRTNLPAPLTNFIGRAQEIAEVRRLLGLTRLLTLTGAGGCGKTRLAQRVAADALIGYSEGVWYAELAALTDPALIADQVVRALGLMATDRPAVEQLNEFLRERQILLVLDNCEHLIEAVALFALQVLRACPRVTIVATSRESLNLEGEMTWRVPPMQLDEAGRLFVDRASAARSDTILSSQDDTVAHICQRLDGMPLAIELAAARLSALSLNDIAARLDDRFNLLAQGRRGALPRHQTLRALIDWSYELLSEPEKLVFRRLGVFVGGWELQQAYEVIGNYETDYVEVQTLLTQLVHKSLVVIEEIAGGVRFRFLETLRQYALEKLNLISESTFIHHRHAQAYLRLIEESVKWLHGPQQKMWLDRLEQNYSNVQSAMEWCLELHGDALTGCQIVATLYHFWYIASGHYNDAVKWTKYARQALSPDMPVSVQAWVLVEENFYLNLIDAGEARTQHIYNLFMQTGDAVNAAVAKTMMGEAAFYARRDYPLALRLSEEGVSEARKLGADWELRFSLMMLGQCLRLSQGDPVRAESVYRESVALSKAAGDLNEYARIWGVFIAGYAMERLEFKEAMNCAEEALTQLTQTEDLLSVFNIRCLLAESLYYLGNVSSAIMLLNDCLEMSDRRLSIYTKVTPNIILARIALSQGAYAQAHVLLAESLALRLSQVKPGELIRGGYAILDVMAVLAAELGQANRAAQLRGVADNMYMRNHHYRKANIAWEFAPYIAKARAALGDAAYEAAYAEGREMPLDQAIAYALS